MNFPGKSIQTGKWNPKILVSGVCLVLLIGLYCLIFAFSDQDAEASGSLSTLVTEKCVRIVNTLAHRNWSDALMKSMVDYLEHPVRKLAHFSEYAMMGALLYGMWRPWKQRGKKLYLLIVSWVFLSAFLDELHQYFVPGRYANFLDVFLDTFGGCCGMAFCVLVEKIWRRWRRKLAGKV